MKTQLFTYQTVHLPDEAKIQWSEPHALKDDPSWTVDLEIQSWPNGFNSITYFGTEAQIRTIAGGRVETVDAPDPAQLDALEVDEPKLLSVRLDMVDLATRAAGLGGVKSW